MAFLPPLPYVNSLDPLKYPSDAPMSFMRTKAKISAAWRCFTVQLVAAVTSGLNPPLGSYEPQGGSFDGGGKGGEGNGRFTIDGFVGARYRPRGLAASLR